MKKATNQRRTTKPGSTPRGAAPTRSVSGRPAPAQRGRPRAVVLVAGAVLTLVGAVAVAAVAGVFNPSRGAAQAGVQTFENLSQEHVRTPVDYPQQPPVGGAHSPAWQNCGAYPAPVANEAAVHSMEHGAVWLTYRPDLPPEQVEALRALARGQTFILVSPFPNLPAPVVASAWGRQLRVQTAGDGALAEFVRAFRIGPQTPEPGAPCTGGIGQPG